MHEFIANSSGNSLGLQKTRIEADFRRGAGKIGKKGIFYGQKSNVIA